MVGYCCADFTRPEFNESKESADSLLVDVICRILANLYSGTVYIWNTNDQVGFFAIHFMLT